jgi:hypothetical protein
LSQPRLTQGQERADLLRAVFHGSVINEAIIDVKKDAAEDDLKESAAESTMESVTENT